MIKSMKNHLFEIIVKKDSRLCLNRSVIVEKITNNIKNRVLIAMMALYFLLIFTVKLY